MIGYLCEGQWEDQVQYCLDLQPGIEYWSVVEFVVDPCNALCKPARVKMNSMGTDSAGLDCSTGIGKGIDGDSLEEEEFFWFVLPYLGKPFWDCCILLILWLR